MQPIRETSEKKRVATKDRRVVVTGMGMVSPLGHDADTFYDNLLEGRSGIREIQGFDCKDFPTVNIRTLMLLWYGARLLTKHWVPRHFAAVAPFLVSNK